MKRTKNPWVRVLGAVGVLFFGARLIRDIGNLRNNGDDWKDSAEVRFPVQVTLGNTIPPARVDAYLDSVCDQVGSAQFNAYLTAASSQPTNTILYQALGPAKLTGRKLECQLYGEIPLDVAAFHKAFEGSVKSDATSQTAMPILYAQVDDDARFAEKDAALYIQLRIKSDTLPKLVPSAIDKRLNAGCAAGGKVLPEKATWALSAAQYGPSSNEVFATCRVVDVPEAMFPNIDQKLLGTATADTVKPAFDLPAS